jgi:hypothetical protein
MHEELRHQLKDKMKGIHTGQDLDNLERKLRQDFGTHDASRSIISALSKIAAFIYPETFVAWDSFAKKGLNRVRGCSASRKFEVYSDYLAKFDEVWEGELGAEIRQYMKHEAKADIVSAIIWKRRF